MFCQYGKNVILHFWLQCPSASQQTGWEELQPLTFPWLQLLWLHPQAQPSPESLHRGWTSFWAASSAANLHTQPIYSITDVWSLLRLFELSSGKWVTKKEYSPQIDVYDWPWRGRRSEYADAAKPSRYPSHQAAGTNKQWQFLNLVVTDTKARH